MIHIHHTMEHKSNFRLALMEDIPEIWDILRRAILRRKADGSNQWQDGYPNPEVIKVDIEKNAGYVLMINEKIAGYIAIYINDEPAYLDLVGEWLSQTDFVVYHRVAVAEAFLGHGYAQMLMNYVEYVAHKNKITSIKADTNFDNQQMLYLFKKLGYTYCGEVTFRGTPRKAFEKLLHSTK